jgi:putative RecB family exonuclease
MPLDMVDPDALHVSVSQLKTWLRCPRQYELKYIRGAEPELVPYALVFGSAFHAALAAHYGEKQAGRALTAGELVDVFSTSWADHRDRGVPIEVPEKDGDPVALAQRMLAVFLEHDAGSSPEVLAVEQPVTAVLHDPETGEVLEERLTGFVDLLLREDGRTVVVENKTSARRYAEEQLRFDVQLTAYQLALRQSGVDDVGLRYQVVTKTKLPVVQIEDVRRDEQDEEDFLRTAVGVLRAIDAGVSYPLRGWQCRSCPFRQACR